MLARGILKPAALSRKIGKGCRQISENLFRRAKRSIGFHHLGIGAAAAARVLSRFVADGFFFGCQARDGMLGVCGKALLPLGIGRKLNEPQIEFDDAVLGAGLFAIKILQGNVQTMQGRARARLGATQFGK